MSHLCRPLVFLVSTALLTLGSTACIIVSAEDRGSYRRRETHHVQERRAAADIQSKSGSTLEGEARFVERETGGQSAALFVA